MAEIIEMPKLSDTMTVGTLAKWLKQEGDTVKPGDMLAEIETDKATTEVENPRDGTLLKIFAEPGVRLPVGAPLCAIGHPGETLATPPPSAPASAPGLPSAAPSGTSDPPVGLSGPDAPPATPPDAGDPPMPAFIPAGAPAAPRIRISPLARKFAKEKGIDYTRLQGSGRGGRIVRADIVAAEAAGIAGPGAAPAGKPPPGTPGAHGASGASAAPAGHFFARGPIQEERTIAIGSMRATIARRLLEAKTTIPHLYLDTEADAAPLLALRQQLNTGLAADGVKLSLNDLILKAAAEALRRVPAVNASWEGPLIRRHPAAHLSFAVATPDGLLTPVIRDAHLKTLFQISAEARTLDRKAKDRKLTPAELTGGTFCVSNLGMLGVTKFHPIVPPSNSAALGAGATVTKPVVKNDRIEIGRTMTLTLSCDHRVVDGTLAARYLAALKTLLENPALLLV
jgi:pyruvate dehydrogenase E2 component (dihydrolipoamide acetyltransferase)